MTVPLRYVSSVGWRPLNGLTPARLPASHMCRDIEQSPDGYLDVITDEGMNSTLLELTSGS